MIKWHCDICGTETHVNPPMELLYEDKEFEIDVPDYNENGDVSGIKKEKRIEKIPKIAKAKRQNMHTGKIEDPILIK